MPKFPFIVRRISGDSMLPTLKPGDVVIGYRWFKPEKGDVVIAAHENREIIKRITRREGARWYLEGDNIQFSTDSRSFGALDEDALLARVIYPRTTRPRTTPK